MGALKVIDIHLHQTYLKVRTQTSAFLGSTSCSEKQVSILSVSVLAPPCTDSYRHMQSYSTCAAFQFNVNSSCRNFLQFQFEKLCSLVWGLLTRASVTVAGLFDKQPLLQSYLVPTWASPLQGFKREPRFTSIWVHRGAKWASPLCGFMREWAPVSWSSLNTSWSSSWWRHLDTWKSSGKGRTFLVLTWLKNYSCGPKMFDKSQYPDSWHQYPLSIQIQLINIYLKM